ncbi:Cytochrome P450 84A1, partial [Zea mays]
VWTPHAGRDVRRDGDGGVGDRVGHGGDDAQPRRPAPGAAGARRRRGPRPQRERVGPGQAPLPQVRHQGDAPAAPAHPAAPPRDRRRLRRGRVLRAQGLPRHGQRLGHRPPPRLVEGRRRVPPVAVRGARGGGRGARLQGRVLRVPAVRVGPPVLPRDGARPVRAGARRRPARARLQLVAARRNEALGDGHGRHLRPYRAARHAALRRAYAPAQLPLVLTPCTWRAGTAITHASLGWGRRGGS